jgi:transcriptional regulator with PAS, ATPase and Fis domain
MREVLEMTRRASESEPTTILIHGESGTGKEVLAKAITTTVNAHKCR